MLGGIIVKNADGEPNGILLENAGNAIRDIALDPDRYPALRYLAYDGLLWSLEKLAKNGITSVVDARVYRQRDHDKVENTHHFAHRTELISIKNVLTFQQITS